jgi:hypothetical protein
LFGADGEPSAFLKNAMSFLKTVEKYAFQTKEFGEAVLAAEILSPARLEITGADGKKVTISGARIVDRRKLKALSPDVVMDLVRRDYLELIYLHLASLSNGRAVVGTPSENGPRKEAGGVLRP